MLLAKFQVAFFSAALLGVFSLALTWSLLAHSSIVTLYDFDFSFFNFYLFMYLF